MKDEELDEDFDEWCAVFKIYEIPLTEEEYQNIKKGYMSLRLNRQEVIDGNAILLNVAETRIKGLEEQLDQVYGQLGREEERVKELESEVSYMDSLSRAKIEADQEWARLEEKVKELERLLCISHDYLKDKWEMEAAPLHEIDGEVKEILKRDQTD